MAQTPTETTRLDARLRSTLIRDLVETYPAAMPVLNSYGIDICCGGGLTIPEAASAHQLEGDTVIEEVRRAVSGEGS